MLITVHCAKCVGINAVPVTVEVDMASGIGIHLVGLADAAVKESLLRTITDCKIIVYKNANLGICSIKKCKFALFWQSGNVIFTEKITKYAQYRLLFGQVPVHNGKVLL